MDQWIIKGSSLGLHSVLALIAFVPKDVSLRYAPPWRSYSQRPFPHTLLEYKESLLPMHVQPKLKGFHYWW